MTNSDSGRDKIVERLKAAMEQLRLDMTRVEMWAMALEGFSNPVPDYRPDHHLLPQKSRDRAERR